MKKLAVFFVVTGFCLCLCAQSVLDPELVVDVVLKKLDDQTLEVKTTTTTVNTVKHDKAVLQTELDDIPGFIAEHQAHIDALNERAVEIRDMLKVLE